MVVTDLVPVDSVQIQAGTVSVQVMAQVVLVPSIEIVEMATVAVVVAAAVAVDPDSFDLWQLDLDLTSSRTCSHWMASQESYLKTVHPNHHFVSNPVQNLNVAVPIELVPCSWVGFGWA